MYYCVYLLLNSSQKKEEEMLSNLMQVIEMQVLVGESLIKQPDPAKGITNLFGKDISV